MILPTINESKYIKKAKSLLIPGERYLNFIPDHYTKEQKENQLHFWYVLERIKFLRQNLSRAGNRGDATQTIEVDADYCFDIGEKQNWLCAISGDEMEFTRGGTNFGGKWCNPKSCTIDRIDSGKGYVKGNIQLVTWEINGIKSHHDNDQFIDLCRRVAKFNK